MNLLRSRKFVLALVAIIAHLVALISPDLRPHAAEFGGILFAIVGLMGGWITLEDAVRVWAGRPATLDAAIQAAVSEGLEELKKQLPQIGQSDSAMAWKPPLDRGVG